LAGAARAISSRFVVVHPLGANVELAKLNENHKLLANLAGSWTS